MMRMCNQPRRTIKNMPMMIHPSDSLFGLFALDYNSSARMTKKYVLQVKSSSKFRG
jgi:hypothetical protein